MTCLHLITPPRLLRHAHRAIARALLLFGLLLGAPLVLAQSPLDGFEADAGAAINPVRAIATQPNGTLLIGGSFQEFNGQGERKFLVRVDHTGVVIPMSASVNGAVHAIAPLPDGRFWIGGNFQLVNGVTHGSVACLRSDGALNGTPLTRFNDTINTMAVLPNGQLLVGGSFTIANGANVPPNLPRNRMARLHPDSSLDLGFNPNVDDEVRAIAVRPDGKIWIGGSFSSVGGVPRNGLARLNADGSLDESFGNVDLNNIVHAISILQDGKIWVGGDFTFVGATARNHMALLDENGVLQAAIADVTGGAVRALALLPDGKLLLGGAFTSVNSVARLRSARIDRSGMLDYSFDAPVSGGSTLVHAITVQDDGKAVIGGGFTTVNGFSRRNIARLYSDGRVDATVSAGASAQTDAVVVQSDGKVLVGGGFGHIGDVGRNRIARFHPDGTLDTSFNPNANSNVLAIAVVENTTPPEILIGGTFTSVANTPRNRIARLGPTGTLRAFNPDADGGVRAIAQQPNGKILIAGTFTMVGGTERSRVARLNNDGSLDFTFFDTLTDAQVNTLALQRDGKVLIGGEFANVRNVTRNRIARLESNGTIDTSFNPNANAPVFTLAVQPDGKILVGGEFTSIGGATRSRIARFNANGELDTQFNASVSGGSVRTIAIQSDGKILIGGISFTTVNGVSRNRIARLNADGTLDNEFDPNINSQVSGIALQGDGKVWAVGLFTSVGGTERNNIARLANDTPARYDITVRQDEARWRPSGSAPAPSRVYFEGVIGQDGLVLGAGVFSAGEWLLSGLNVPVQGSGFVHVRSFHAGGRGNGSNSILEREYRVIVLPPLGPAVFSDGFE